MKYITDFLNKETTPLSMIITVLVTMFFMVSILYYIAVKLNVINNSEAEINMTSFIYVSPNGEKVVATRKNISEDVTSIQVKELLSSQILDKSKENLYYLFNSVNNSNATNIGVMLSGEKVKFTRKSKQSMSDESEKPLGQGYYWFTYISSVSVTGTQSKVDSLKPEINRVMGIAPEIEKRLELK